MRILEPASDRRVGSSVERLRRSRLRLLATAVRHRRLTAGDVFLASFPRSGNTWVKFMLAELLSGTEVTFDSSDLVVPIVGLHRETPGLLPGGGRLLKTHEPYRRAYGRAIYIVRDLRDVAPSYWRVRKMQSDRDGTPEASFPDFLGRFARGEIDGYGSWHDHVDSWLDALDASADVLLVHYEPMVDDPEGELRRMVAFLGLEVEDARLTQIVANNSPQAMAERRGSMSREHTSIAMATATYGGWRDLYSAEELALLAPAAPAMRRLGYAVSREMDDPDPGAR